MILEACPFSCTPMIHGISIRSVGSATRVRATAPAVAECDLGSASAVAHCRRPRPRRRPRRRPCRERRAAPRAARPGLFALG